MSRRAFLLAAALAFAPASGFSAPSPADGSGAVLIPGAPAPAEAPFAHRDSGGFSAWAVVVVLGALGGAWVWARLRRGSAGPLGGKGERLLSLPETRSLGNRQFLVVADYAGQKYLLGVCPGRIDLLAPLGRKDEAPQ